MSSASTKNLGEELLRQPVKRVNHVTTLLQLLSATDDEVAILYMSQCCQVRLRQHERIFCRLHVELQCTT